MGNRSRLERLFGPRGREWSITLHLLANPLSVAGLAMITGILFCVILAPWMTVYNLNAINVDASFSPPSLEHIFGTDSLGRDIFTRILFGGQFTLLIGLSIVIVGGSVGSIVGMTTGYFGGYFDNLIMRIADIVLAFPPIILAIAISGALGPGIVSVVSALTFTTWPRYARLTQGSCLSIKETEFIEAARASGESTTRVILRHILPNALPQILVMMTLDIAHYPPIMDPAVVEAHGGMLSKEAETYFGENSGGAGSGPFTIDHWARGKEIVMKRWPNYWGGPLDLKPRFENVICKIVAEPANQFMMLKTGDLSIGGGVMGSLTMDQQLALKSASDIVTETNPTPSMFVISMSTSHKDSPFRNLKVRQAIKAAVNSTRIAAVFKGLAFEAGGAVPKGVLGYDPSLVGYIRYDTARAKQLLKEAGYENGFATDFLISKGFWSGVSREDLALLVSEDLAKIGIAVTVRAVPYAEWRNELAGGTYKGLFGAFWFSDYPDPENNAVAFSSTGGLMALRAGFNETISPAFAETTRMNRQATVTVDSAERARLYKEIQKIDLDTGPTVYVLQASTVNVYQKYIRGFVFNPICDTYPIFLWKE